MTTLSAAAFETLMDALEFRRMDLEKQQHLYVERRFGSFTKQARENIGRGVEHELRQLEQAEKELQAVMKGETNDRT